MVTDRLREAARAFCDKVSWFPDATVQPLFEELRAALDAEPEPAWKRYEDKYGEMSPPRKPSPTETIAWTESIHGDRIEIDVPSPTNEERVRSRRPEWTGNQKRARELIGMWLVANPSVSSPFGMKKCGRDLMDDVQEALDAAEARGLERAAQWHNAEEEKCKQRIKEMSENPLRLARCKEDGSLHMMTGLAAEHREYAAAIRALGEG